ncbi:hypothetical protein [Modicisalibacter luteus]|uniref:Twin-arginine translocation signal domain-containing protein n=1 Tax=Modicisalibacter luteus TaxID=453962 RepID=A0ABV7M570_9GAMM|nr:hypothetical protein [Halomonas lutea]GHB07613.1 hypothetical protein GCM10007159_32030 [Halomonas lutea]
MPPQQQALPFTLRQSLSRRRFLNRLGLGSLALTGPFTASAHAIRPLEAGRNDSFEAPFTSQDNTPRTVNGWLLRESDF